MKVIDYCWIGFLVHDYDTTCNFMENVLGLEKEWRDDKKNITMFRLPSGQEFEIYAPSNRARKEKYQYYNGPVIGLSVDDIEQARKELTAQGAKFVDAIEGLEDGTVKWTHFWGPDGQFYSLHQFSEWHSGQNYASAIALWVFPFARIPTKEKGGRAPVKWLGVGLVFARPIATKI